MSERTTAEQACMHIMDQVIRNPRLAYYIGPYSGSYELLTAAVAEIRGESPEQYRAYIGPHIRAEAPNE